MLLYPSGDGDAVALEQVSRWPWIPGSMGNYKGLNTTWRDPSTGHLFELQFHTPDSFWVNKAEHPFYEISRAP